LRQSVGRVDHRAVQDRADQTSLPVTHPGPGRVRDRGVGRQVQPPPPLRVLRRHPTGRARGRTIPSRQHLAGALKPVTFPTCRGGSPADRVLTQMGAICARCRRSPARGPGRRRRSARRAVSRSRDTPGSGLRPRCCSDSDGSSSGATGEGGTTTDPRAVAPVRALSDPACP
jgi:hypothetical protein